MKRLPGVIFSAVILALGSLFQLLMAALMVFAGTLEKTQTHSSGGLSTTVASPTPAWMPMFSYGLGVFCILLAVWGILTTVGLFRMRRWARISTLVIGGCLAILGVPSMLMMLVMTMVPFPTPATVDPSQAHTIQMATRIGLGVGAAVYALVSAVGISWLVYFNRKAVREAFAGGSGQLEVSRRPFLIAAVTVLLAFGGASCLLMAFLPFPGAFMGMMLHGWEKSVFYLAYGAVIAAAGIGLWQLKEWARRLAMVMQVFGLAQFVVYMARPSLLTNYSTEVNQAHGFGAAPDERTVSEHNVCCDIWLQRRIPFAVWRCCISTAKPSRRRASQPGSAPCGCHIALSAAWMTTMFARRGTKKTAPVFDGGQVALVLSLYESFFGGHTAGWPLAHGCLGGRT